MINSAPQQILPDVPILLLSPSLGAVCSDFLLSELGSHFHVTGMVHVRLAQVIKVVSREETYFSGFLKPFGTNTCEKLQQCKTANSLR